MEKSIQDITRKHPGFYEKHKQVLKKLLLELHVWFDAFESKKSEEYDYTGINCIKHREQRHHSEGRGEAIKIFSRKYGTEFANIISEEATSHIYEDMGHIFYKEDYRSIGFWKRVRGW